MAEQRAGSVVVGVDGSEHAHAALQAAADEARTHGWELRVVTAFALPTVVGPPGAMWPVESMDELEEAARAIQDRALEGVSERSLADVIVHRTVLPGDPARVLLDAARGADLLVVGSRGRGGFAGLLLGSVSQQCAVHAPCAVLIVRPSRTSRETLGGAGEQSELASTAP